MGTSLLREDPVVELGRIELPSISPCTEPLRPFPTSSLTLATRRVERSCDHRHIFPCGQRSFSPSVVFPTVIGYFWCRAVADWPRAASLLTMTVGSPVNQAATANCSSAILVGAPFSESEQLGSQTRTTALTSKPVSPVCGM